MAIWRRAFCLVADSRTSPTSTPSSPGGCVEPTIASMGPSRCGRRRRSSKTAARCSPSRPCSQRCHGAGRCGCRGITSTPDGRSSVTKITSGRPSSILGHGRSTAEMHRGIMMSCRSRPPCASPTTWRTKRKPWRASEATASTS